MHAYTNETVSLKVQIRQGMVHFGAKSQIIQKKYKCAIWRENSKWFKILNIITLLAQIFKRLSLFSTKIQSDSSTFFAFWRENSKCSKRTPTTHRLVKGGLVQVSLCHLFCRFTAVPQIESRCFTWVYAICICNALIDIFYVSRHSSVGRACDSKL